MLESNRFAERQGQDPDGGFGIDYLQVRAVVPPTILKANGSSILTCIPITIVSSRGISTLGVRVNLQGVRVNPQGVRVNLRGVNVNPHKARVNLQGVSVRGQGQQNITSECTQTEGWGTWYAEISDFFFHIWCSRLGK